MKLKLPLVAAIAGLAVLAKPVPSQAADPHVASEASPPSRLEGSVKDALGRGIAGARISLQDARGKDVASAISDARGRFNFKRVPVGTYAVVADKKDFQTGTAIVSITGANLASAAIVMTANKPLDVTLAARQLHVARNAIRPSIGASAYTFSRTTIANEPEGGNRAFNKVLLQAPGVTQDSFGQLHVRGDHGDLQYRINGTILPEGIAGFGQALSPRFADHAQLITGALPARYGLRTAGIVDIQTKSGAYSPGGSLSLYGGSHDTIQPSFEYGGSKGSFNYYVNGDYLQNGLGIESPTAAANPLHDNTQQGHGFAYLEDLLDPTTRISLILGLERGVFQIPNIPGQMPTLGLNVNGTPQFDSARLNEHQRETTQYAVASYLKSTGPIDVQFSAFERYSSLNYGRDTIGDLLFNGISQNASRSSTAEGIQGDGSYRFNDRHTLRGGIFVQAEHAISKTNSLVLPVDGNGNQTSSVPLEIFDSGHKTGWTYSAYLQDEWRLTRKLTLNYGLRFDAVDAFTQESQFSPRINAVFQATPSTTLHAGYARYFTPPPFELLSSGTLLKFVGTSAAPALMTNSPVKAERADYFDVGVRQRFRGGFNVGLDGYYKESRNLLDEGQFGAPIILTPFNYAEGRQYGIELTSSMSVGRFSAYGNLAVSQAIGRHIVSAQFNFNPADLAYIQNHFISLDHEQTYTASAGASYLWRGTRFGIDSIYGSGLRTDGTVPNGASLPPYTQVDLGVSRKFKTGRKTAIEARFDVINLLDERYEIRDGSGIGVGAPQFGPRRGFFAGVKYEF